MDPNNTDPNQDINNPAPSAPTDQPLPPLEQTPPPQPETPQGPDLTQDQGTDIIPAPEDDLISPPSDVTGSIPFTPVPSSEPIPPEEFPSPGISTEPLPEPTPAPEPLPDLSSPETFTPPTDTTVSAPEPIPAPADSSPQKSSGGTLRIFLIGLVLVLLGTLIGVLAANFIPQTAVTSPAPTPTPGTEVAPTSDTQTIESSVYGFRVLIPSSWTPVSTESAFPYLFQYQSQDDSTFEILVQDLPAGSSLTDYLASQDQISQTAFEGRPSKRVISSSEITVNGMVGVEREEEFLAAGLTGRVIYISGATKIYSLSFVPGSTTVPVTSSEVYLSRDTILNSFTLIGAEGSTP